MSKKKVQDKDVIRYSHLKIGLAWTVVGIAVLAGGYGLARVTIDDPNFAKAFFSIVAGVASFWAMITVTEGK